MEHPKESPDSKASSIKKKVLFLIIVMGAILVGVMLWFYKKDVEYRMDESSATNAYSIDDVFKLPEFMEIENHYKDCVLSVFEVNGYLEDHKYFLTTIHDRAKNVFAFGDFTNTNLDEAQYDMAFVLEGNDFKSSCIFITSMECNVLYFKNFEDEIPYIHAFKKGAQIYLDRPKLEASPVDGLILEFKNRKEVLIYNSISKSFESYYQFSENDFIESEEYYEDESSFDVPENPDPVDTIPEDTMPVKEAGNN